MTTIQFLAEWALRSSILIAGGALLLRVLRVKDASINLAAWTAILFGSLAIPALSMALPRVPLLSMRAASQPAPAPETVFESAPALELNAAGQDSGGKQTGVRASRRFDWVLAALAVYTLGAAALLLRLGCGLAMSLRLKRGSRASGRDTESGEIRESDRVASPVTLGIVRPAIVLPLDWRQWDAAKLGAVLAHERSHIRRRDPAVQLLSAIHRALLWFSPLTWFLHQRIVRVAEEASDDAAVAVIHDRALYAEALLDFMRRGVRHRGFHWAGVPMARYGRPDRRIHRILDGTTLSRGVTRWSVAAILALGSPLAYLVAAAHPGSAPQAARAPIVVAAPLHQQASDESAKPNGLDPTAPAATRMTAQLKPQSSPPANPAAPAKPAPSAGPQSESAYLNALGAVTAKTVTIRPRVEGQLMSVSFKEGDQVEAGQLLASIDPRPYQIQFEQALAQLERDEAALQNASSALSREQQLAAQGAISKPQVDALTATVAELNQQIKADTARVDDAKLRLTYGQVRAPISGIAGLLLVDPGNVIQVDTRIVVINQLQPITVQCSIPEDNLAAVRKRLSDGSNIRAEAWNRQNSMKIASGLVTAVDNQMDPQTGRVNVRAIFDNKDGALFPNQFVNVRLYLGGR